MKNTIKFYTTILLIIMLFYVNIVIIDIFTTIIIKILGFVLLYLIALYFYAKKTL